MFSVQELLGQKNKFYDLLEACAQEAQERVDELVKLSANPAQAPHFDDFIRTRRKASELRGQINEAVYNTFVTALERDDIESLANALYRIPKAVEKFAGRLLLNPPRVQGVDFSRQINLLTQSTATVVEMVQALRADVDLEKIRQLNQKMQELEGEADRAVADLLRDLYADKCDPVTVIMRKDLYELLEKIIDRCRDVGNIITNIALKNA